MCERRSQHFNRERESGREKKTERGREEGKGAKGMTDTERKKKKTEKEQNAVESVRDGAQMGGPARVLRCLEEVPGRRP